MLFTEMLIFARYTAIMIKRKNIQMGMMQDHSKNEHEIVQISIEVEGVTDKKDIDKEIRKIIRKI